MEQTPDQPSAGPGSLDGAGTGRRRADVSHDATPAVVSPAVVSPTVVTPAVTTPTVTTPAVERPTRRSLRATVDPTPTRERAIQPPPPATDVTDAPVSRRARREAAAHDAPRSAGTVVEVDVVVIGAGQAGLSVAHHLRKAGLVAVGERGWPDARATFVVLDEAPEPGGAWQHRPPGMRMADAHGVHDLPGMPLLVPDPDESAARAVPYYFAQYEEAFGLHVQRPVAVTRVEDSGDRLAVASAIVGGDEQVTWRARGLVNATGTWRKPFWPAYPGRGAFRGRQVHARDVLDPADLADGHVVVVGAGTSAVQLLLALAPLTSTTWVTRRPPLWREGDFTPEVGRAAVALVEERTRAGLPPGSVVSVTGLPLTDEYRAGIAAGVLRARPAFSRLVADGAVWDQAVPPPVPAVSSAAALGAWVDGPAHVAARTVVWATGYRPALDHLAPLHLRGAGGGVVMRGTQVAADPRIHLVGYGPSASTIGANRAGRDAVRALLAHLSLPTPT